MSVDVKFPAALCQTTARPSDLPAALKTAQQAQGAALATLNVPSRKTEDWRYSSKHIKMLDAVTQSPALVSVAVDESLQDFDGYRVVLVNGCLDKNQSSLPDNQQLIVKSFTELDSHEAELLLSGRAFSQTELPFTVANNANLQDGLLVRVPAGQTVDKPLLIHSHSEGVGCTFPRVYVMLEKGAEIAIIEEHTGQTPASLLTASVVEVDLQDNAQLTLTRLDLADEAIAHVGATLVKAGRDSRLNTHCFGFGGQLRRHDLKVQMLAPGAECNLNGVCVTLGKQHYDNHTEIEHIAAHCNSEENYRCIAADQSQIVFNGRIHIHRDAQKTSGAMNNKNLLLSSSAEIDTKPELEIYADDVKCAHGATVGQLDEEEIYYLQTRGISKHHAETMLTLGFVLELVNQVPNESCQQLLNARMEAFIASAVEGQAAP